MSKKTFLHAILITALILFTGTTVKAQCTILSYNSLKAVWDNKTKNDVVLDLGFEKRSGNHFARCKMEMCHTKDSTGRNYNEFIFIYDDEVMYSFVDAAAYQKLKAEVKGKTEYAGFAMFDKIKREYYYDGKICYCFYVGDRACLSMKVTDYNVGFLEKVPSYVEKE
jgi:hypothetical protein